MHYATLVFEFVDEQTRDKFFADNPALSIEAPGDGTIGQGVRVAGVSLADAMARCDRFEDALEQITENGDDVHRIAEDALDRDEAPEMERLRTPVDIRLINILTKPSAVLGFSEALPAPAAGETTAIQRLQTIALENGMVILSWRDLGSLRKDVPHLTEAEAPRALQQLASLADIWDDECVDSQAARRLVTMAATAAMAVVRTQPGTPNGL
jgi:hypothetical protein